MCDLMPASGALPGVGDCDIDAFLTKLRAETTALTWVGLCLAALLWLLPESWPPSPQHCRQCWVASVFQGKAAAFLP